LTPYDEHDFRKALINHIALLQTELDRVESSIEALPVGQRDGIEGIRERISNILGVMKADLQRLS
jgi:hypothetical protein